MSGVRWDEVDQQEVAEVAIILEETLNREGNETDDCYTGAEGIAAQVAVDRHYGQPITRDKLLTQFYEIYRVDGENWDEALREEALNRVCEYYGVES